MKFSLLSGKSVSAGSSQFSFPRKRKRVVCIGLFCVLGASVRPAWADTDSTVTPPLDMDALKQQITAQVTDLVNKQQQEPGWEDLKVQYEVWLPDSAVHLPACQKPLDIVLSGRLTSLWGHQNYRVTCPDPHGWQLRAQLTVTAQLPVWTAAVSIRKGQPIQAQDLRLDTVTLNNLHQGFSVKTDSLSDFRPQRLISAGQVVDPSLLMKPLMIHRGDQLLIKAQQEGFTASMRGEALEDGVAGAMIRVRNLSSGKEIQAEVSAKGVVLVRF